MVKLNRILTKGLGIFLSAVIMVLTFVPVGFAVEYPQGITSEQANTAMTKTDQAINAVLNITEGKRLADFVLPIVLSDATLSALVKLLYDTGEENAEIFTTLGIARSPAGIAQNLVNYPDVQARLMHALSWDEVDLTNAVWGVDNTQEFADAAVALLLPMNDLLYTLLCGGSYSVNSLVGVKGSNGYEQAVVQIFRKFGMQSYTDPATFVAQATSDKTTMIRNLVKDVTGYIELVCSSPATMLSTNLPGIAYFIENGGLDNAIAQLVEPLKIKILGITTPLKVGNIMESAQQGESGMSLDVNLDIGSFTATGTLVTAPFDMHELASFATENVDTYVVNTADSFIYVLRWLLETVKLNIGTLPEMLSGASSEIDAAKISQILTGLFSKTVDEIISVYIGLFAATSGRVNPYMWSFNTVNPAVITYTPNLGAEKYQRVLDGIDALISEFVKEGGEAENLREAVAPEIYSNALVTKLVSGIYSVFASEQLKTFADLAGLDLSPAALGARLTEPEYASVSNTLKGMSNFAQLEQADVSWGFKNGDRDGFIRTVSACFRPFEGLLKMLLCGDSYNLLGAVPFYGSDGYNTAVIPILEALGCNFDEIRTFDEYFAQIRQTDVMFPIVQSLVSLVERFIDYPVYTLTGILPNLMYFINNGGIEICITNLLYPVTSILDSLGLSQQFDFSSLIQIDTDKIMSDLMGSLDLGITLPELDLAQFGSMGVLVTAQTKRTQITQPMTVQYLQADRTGVLITLLRYMVQIMKTPGNEGIVDSFLSSNGDNEMFATYSSDIGTELANMTVDETVEFLYKIFFRERATVDESTFEDYTPTIIYKEKSNTGMKVVLGVLLALIIAAAVLAIIYRKKLPELIQKIKNIKTREA